MRQFNAESKQNMMPKHYEWNEVFFTLFTQPKVETIQTLLQDPEAKAKRAYLWMLLPSAMNGIAVFMASPVLNSDWLVFLLLGSIVGAIWGLGGFIFSGWLMQRVAAYLGGDANGYGKLHYARGSYMPVISIVYTFALLLLGGNANIVSFIIAAIFTVELLLTGLALRAVNNNLSWTQVMASAASWYLLMFLLSLVRI